MEVHPNAWFLFVCFVLVVTFVMVNLIIAIVVEAMNKISHDEKNHISKKIQESENATKGDLKRLEDKIEKLGGLVEKKR
jgi:voltage-gated sodium channel